MAGTKRKHGEDSSDAVYSNKSRSRPSVEARVDPTYGQRSAIPGLDGDTVVGGDEDDLNYGEEMDALAYLRSVRQEASGIPNLLVAPRTPPTSDSREIYENGDGDFRGYYQDGAYVASSLPMWGSSDSVEAVELDQQVGYFDSIISRYESLRTQLQQTPPLEAIQNLGPDHPTHVGKLTVALARWWKWKMQTVDPRPAQIATMDKSTVLRLLGLMNNGTMLKRGAEVKVGVSRWVWSLLARLPDRGELTSEEIGVVRELGKKAVLIGVSLQENKSWEEGIREVEKDYDEEEVEESVDIANEDEIDLGIEDEFENEDPESDADIWTADTPADSTFIGPQLVMSEETSATAGNGPDKSYRSGPTPSSSEKPIELLSNRINPIEEARHGENLSKEEGELSSDDSSGISEALAAAKTRLQAQVDQIQNDDLSTEGLEGTDNKEAKVEKQFAQWNTKATVDMIITVAGEIYGQRDLLEFRGAWEDQ